MGTNDDLRDKCLSGFAALVMQDPMGFREARLLGDTDPALQSIQEHLGRILCRKATATLRKRLGSWKLFEAWAVAEGRPRALPLTEGLVFEYSCSDDVVRSPSRLQAFMEALGFTVHVLGHDSEGALATFGSGRLRATAQQNLLSRASLKEATPLTVTPILASESVLFNSTSIVEQVISGGL